MFGKSTAEEREIDKLENVITALMAERAGLQAELEPWREMARMIDHMRDGEQYFVSITYKEFYAGECQYQAVFRCVHGATRPSVAGEGDTPPEAVKAAYDQLGVM